MFSIKFVVPIVVILLILGCSVQVGENSYTFISIFGINDETSNMIFRLVVWVIICLLSIFYIARYRIIIEKFYKLLTTNDVKNSKKLIAKYFGQNKTLFWSQQLLLYFYEKDVSGINEFYIANQTKKNKAFICQFYLCVLYFLEGTCEINFVNKTLSILPKGKKYNNEDFILQAIWNYMKGDYEQARTLSMKITNRYNCSAINGVIKILGNGLM